MIEPSAGHTGDRTPEEALRACLARGDRALGSSCAILQHLLSCEGQSGFSDEIMALVRGMACHLADQLNLALAEHAQVPDPEAYALRRQPTLVALIMDNPPVLGHLHALALEWQCARNLQDRIGLDPDLSPLLQALIASDDQGKAVAAMALLVAQARFILQTRRMELPLSELPGDLFHIVLLCFRNGVDTEDEPGSVAVEKQLRLQFDESRGRIGLLSRLVTAMGGGTLAALDIAHAGAALFFSALAQVSGQTRSGVIRITPEQHRARYALTLRATGMKPEMVRQQFAHIHPDCSLPEGVLELSPDHASSLLAETLPVMAD